MSKQKITIYENNTFAGTGDLMDNGQRCYVANCPAELGANSAESDAAYEAIDAAINAGENSATINSDTWTWEIEDDE